MKHQDGNNQEGCNNEHFVVELYLDETCTNDDDVTRREVAAPTMSALLLSWLMMTRIAGDRNSVIVIYGLSSQQAGGLVFAGSQIFQAELHLRKTL